MLGELVGHTHSQEEAHVRWWMFVNLLGGILPRCTVDPLVMDTSRILTTIVINLSKAEKNAVMTALDYALSNDTKTTEAKTMAKTVITGKYMFMTKVLKAKLGYYKIKYQT